MIGINESCNKPMCAYIPLSPYIFSQDIFGLDHRDDLITDVHLLGW